MRAGVMLILIVEDNAIVAFMIEEALTHAGHEVLGPVSQLDEAIALAEQFRPQVALVDIDLADETSGVEIARQLMTMLKIPSVFATGQSETAHQNADAAIGVIAKPYSPSDIVAAIGAISEELSGRRPIELPACLRLFR